MTEKELAEIEARCEAATPGPWKLFDGYKLPDNAIGEKLAAVKWFGCEMSAGVRSDCGCDIIGNVTDLELIAHARTDIPALVAEVRASHERERRLREALKELDRNGYLGCVVGPPCKDCTVCRARKALQGDGEG